MGSSNELKLSSSNESTQTKTPQTGDVEVAPAQDHVPGHAGLERNFNLLSMCAVGIVTGNAWAALGGSISIALYNGGPTGVIFELIVVSVFYWIIAAIIAELASAIPSSAGVYHWSAVTGGPKYGKLISWYGGWWNCMAWLLGAASMSAILAEQIITMWQLFHEDYTPSAWNTFVVFLIITWSSCFLVLYGNRSLPRINDLMLFFILAGVVITIMVCAIMPSQTGAGYASNKAVWGTFTNLTGWSNGLTFATGMLNGAFSVGAVDCVSHLSEETAKPRRNIPIGIGMQMVIGFVTAFLYIIAMFYAINDFDAVMAAPYLNPLGEVYRQATNSRGGALGLMIVIFIPTLGNNIGAYITGGRMLYTLGRDNATPFSGWVGSLHPSFHNPFNATIVCAVFCTIMALIQLGSSTAFEAFVGSFVVLSSASYLTAILPYMVTRRRHVVAGPWRMPGWVANPLMMIACLYIVAFIVIFCFPSAIPFDAETMNYASLVTGGITIFVTGWWFWKSSRGYTGPQDVVLQLMHAPDEQDKMVSGPTSLE